MTRIDCTTAFWMPSTSAKDRPVGIAAFIDLCSAAWARYLWLRVIRLDAPDDSIQLSILENADSSILLSRARFSGVTFDNLSNRSCRTRDLFHSENGELAGWRPGISSSGSSGAYAVSSKDTYTSRVIKSRFSRMSSIRRRSEMTSFLRSSRRLVASTWDEKTPLLSR